MVRPSTIAKMWYKKVERYGSHNKSCADFIMLLHFYCITRVLKLVCGRMLLYQFTIKPWEAQEDTTEHNRVTAGPSLIGMYKMTVTDASVNT